MAHESELSQQATMLRDRYLEQAGKDRPELTGCDLALLALHIACHDRASAMSGDLQDEWIQTSTEPDFRQTV